MGVEDEQTKHPRERSSETPRSQSASLGRRQRTGPKSPPNNGQVHVTGHPPIAGLIHLGGASMPEST